MCGKCHEEQQVCPGKGFACECTNDRITLDHHMGRLLYRSKEMRMDNPKKDKAAWFRASGATLKGTGPVGTSVKILERPGPTIIQHLVKNINSARTSCGRSDYPLDKCKDNCSKESSIYMATYNRCVAKKVDTPPQHM